MKDVTAMSNLVNLCLAGGSGATVVSVAAGFVGRQVAHAARRAAQEIVTAEIGKVARDVSELKVAFAKETGGNSGGLRQAVNKHGDDLGQLRSDIAYLKGALSSAAAAPAVQNVQGGS